MSYRKINEVMKRVQHARSAATAFRVAGLASGPSSEDIYLPDLIHVLEDLLPSTDELGEALADIRRCHCGCESCRSKAPKNRVKTDAPDRP